MNPLKRATPVDFIHPAYLPDLDASPPRPGTGCGRQLALGLAFVGVLAAAVWMLLSFIGSQTQPTVERIELTAVPIEPTSQPVTPTLDAWSLTGTALFFAEASPTLDYCAFMTPSPTPRPTLIYTPDAWQATGTAVFLATNPAQTPTAQPTTPKSWCDLWLTPSPTFTPLALSGLSATAMPTATSTPTARPSPTWVSPPSGGGASNIVQPQPQPPTAEPIIVLPTAQPPTAQPTRLPPTLTATATPSPTSTSTPTPTGAASLYLLYAYCAPHPTFLVTNTGGHPRAGRLGDHRRGGASSRRDMVARDGHG